MTLQTFLVFDSAVAQNGSDEEIKIDSSIVILNALVTDKDGAAVKNLGVDAFELHENGERQTIDFVEPQSTPFAAVILIDVSGSMEHRVSLARSAAIRFLDGIRPEDQVSIFSFHRKVEKLQDFSNSKNLRSRIFDLKARGYTALNDAIYKAALELEERNEKRRAIVVLSDGEDTRSGVSASKALKAAQRAHATIYTVDMSLMSPANTRRRQNQQVLKKFSSKTGGTFVATPGGVQLREAFAEIVKDLGVLYTVGYSSTNQSKDGKWRKISLKTAEKGFSVRTREGYYAAKKK
ncbi:MAG: VWA domain-containing protein [Pyrinomonadaceae bacterium]|nr:VWA domain-containing protein [Pyrinomonadaceae bacterium]